MLLAQRRRELRVQNKRIFLQHVVNDDQICGDRNNLLKFVSSWIMYCTHSIILLQTTIRRSPLEFQASVRTRC